MNCVEFRRHLASDPHSTVVDFVRHRNDCARCAEAADRAIAFERDLARVLSVAAPAALVDSILFAQATAERHRRVRARRGITFAAAAALVIAIGAIGMRLEAKALSTEAIEHLEKEPTLLKMTSPVPPSAVIQAFAQRGVTLRHPPAGISFVGCCPMDKHRTVHMVMPSTNAANDPVTVIYVVDQHATRRETFAHEQWQGRSLPLGNGTLILLAKNADDFDRIESAWRGLLD